MLDSFNSRDTLTVGERTVAFHRLDSVLKGAAATRLPFTQRVLLENLLRREDGDAVTREDIEALANWSPSTREEREVAFAPARVLLQDFTGVPVVVGPGLDARGAGSRWEAIPSGSTRSSRSTS